MNAMTVSLSAADIAVILVSLCVVLGVGLWATRRNISTAQEYFVASGQLPWWMIGTAFVSTSVSSEQIVGTVGSAYENGMGIANWEWWSLPCYIVLIAIFIPIYLKNRVTTVPELLTRRFSPACGAVYSYVMLFAYVLIFMVPVLYGGALTFAELTGVNFTIVLWAMVLLVAAYSVKGGLLSVMWTDAVQCIMLMGGGVILYFVALQKIPGGWSAMAAAAPERFHLYHPASDPIAPFAGLIAGSLGLFIFYQATNQVMVQRVFGARSAWDAILGIIFAGFINFFRPMVTCFLGFIVYHWITVMHQAEPLAKQDLAFPLALKVFASGWGLRGIILMGFLAAVMSTLSALSNSASTIFSLDVYKRFLAPGAEDKRVVRMGRLAALASLLLAALVAPIVSNWGIFRYFQQGVTYLSTPFVPVILLGLFWKRTTKEGALAGLLGGLVIQVLVVLADGLRGWHLHWLYLGFIAEMLVFVLVMAVSWITPAPGKDGWEPFLWRPSLLTALTFAPERPWYARLRLWFALYACIFFGLYWWFW